MLLIRRLSSLAKRLYSSQVHKEYSSTLQDQPSILVRKYDLVTLITINNPGKKNALSVNLVSDLYKAFTDFEEDHSSLASVLCGDGGNFCSGFDLDEMGASNEQSYSLFNQLLETYIRKPVVAAVNGYAVGQGFDLALWCDLRVMDETSVLGNFGRRLGSSMSKASISRLQSIVGLSKAMDTLLTGKRIKSEEAFNFGLANRISNCGTAISVALSVAGDLAKVPQAALLHDRATLYQQCLDNKSILIRNRKDIVEDCSRFMNQIPKDMKNGSKIFLDGAGRHGDAISRHLWKSEDV